MEARDLHPGARLRNHLDKVTASRVCPPLLRERVQPAGLAEVAVDPATVTGARP